MINLGDFTLEELTEYMKSMGEGAFRGKQLFRWINGGAEGLDECTNLSKALREKLSRQAEIYLPKIRRKLISKIDGTVKYLFEMKDGNLVESVVMSYHHGYSICISSQVGCRMGCTFCASTLNGLVRNLAPHEITGQIIAAQKDMGIRISNVVIMGIGEPLDNYDNIIRFLKNVNNPEGLGIGYRHITLSTCGLADKIRQLADEEIPVNLALSLHAPSDELRREMMPVAKAYSIAEVLSACDYYFEKTGRRVTFEYALAENKNSSMDCARRLAELLKGRNCHVNLIPVNPVKERSYVRGDKKSVTAFMDYLNKNGVNATLRRELGSDINASCGQLRNSESK
ncbi:MAG: 23S rRNA (adenine(2503)-C(2))-methyltransferase RlmN [Clostridia bacterium]